MQIAYDNKDLAIFPSVAPQHVKLFPLQAARSSEIQKPKTYQYGPDEFQQMDVYTVKDAGDKKAPVLVFLYGGGFVSGNKNISDDVYGNLGTFFSEKGFVTVIPNYRLFSVHKTLFPDGGEDLSLALQKLATGICPEADLSKVFLMGNSAGGVHVATFMYGLEAFPDKCKFKGPKDIEGVTIVGMITLGTPPDFGDPEMADLQKMMIPYYGTAETQHLASVLEMRKKSKFNVPTLIAWSEYDPSIILEGTKKYIAMHGTSEWPSGVSKPDELEAEGHTHISPPIALGLGDKCDKWGNDLVAWLQKQL